jgi:hypothetical protein
LVSSKSNGRNNLHNAGGRDNGESSQKLWDCAKEVPDDLTRGGKGG